MEKPKKNNFKTIHFNSAIHLKETVLDKELVSLLESIKLKKNSMNETDFFDRDSNYQSNTSLVYKYVEPLIHEIINCKFNLRNWWIQKYKKENYHDLHIHGTLPSWFSFILYLKATPKSAKTYFFGPGHPMIPWERFEVQPKPGLFILFPSYIPHSVGYNKDTKRLILSGNIEVI